MALFVPPEQPRGVVANSAAIAYILDVPLRFSLQPDKLEPCPPGACSRARGDTPKSPQFLGVRILAARGERAIELATVNDTETLPWIIDWQPITAVRTLQGLGYTFSAGEWYPPHVAVGAPPILKRRC
jgi:hypothetical protein